MTKRTFLSIAGIILAVACLFVACPNEPDPGPGPNPAPTEYTVTFNNNGGDTEADPRVQTVTPPATTLGTFPQEPTREGYVFYGWNTKSDGTGTYILPTTPITGSFTVYAQWAERVAGSKLVTFDKNGGDTEASLTSKLVVPPDTTVGTLPAIPPSRTGYIFTGWNTERNGSGVEFTNGTTVTADITVYAQWRTAYHYTVTFNKNGGDTEAEPAAKEVVEPAEKIDALPEEPTREGWLFDGWNTKSDGSGTVFGAATPVSGSFTVYAQWVERVAGSKIVTFDKNGGDTEAGPTTKQVAPPATTIDALPTEPTWSGYVFTGWNTKADGSGSGFTAATPVTDDIKVFAQWRPLYRYIVTYDKNGGDIEASPNSGEVVEPATTAGSLPIRPPEREGFLFTGWNTERNGSGSDFEASTTVTGSITVYAQWEQMHVDANIVHFNSNGGTTEANPTSKQVAPPATTVDSLPAEPTLVGYTFTEWNTEADGTGTPFDATTTVTETITVFAQWTLSTHTVTFNKNAPAYANASEAVPASAQGSINGTTLPATPPAYAAGWDAGVSFAGWYPNADGSGAEFTADTPVTEPTVVYAKWTFNAGTPQVVGNTLVHNAPITARTTSGGQGSWSGTENTDGSATYSGGAISYPFPSDYGNYDYVKIEYVSNGTMQVILKKGLTGTDYMPIRTNGNTGGGQYPNLSASGSLEFNVVDAGISSPGIAMQRNSGNATVKFTKVTFTQGNRHTITFDANHPAGESIPSVQVLEGAAIGTLPTPAARSDGYTLVGWYDAASEGTAYNSSSLMPNHNLTLYAQWSAPVGPVPPLNVDFSSGSFSGASLTGVGGVTVTSSTTSSYTYQHSNYNQGIAFKIDIGSAKLSDYDKISFTVNSTTGGNSQNKQCNVAASQSSVPAYVNPNTTNAVFVTTYNGSGNIIGSTWPTTLVYTIDKTKAASLTGEIWLAVLINAGSGSNYTISDFKISQFVNVDFSSESFTGASLTGVGGVSVTSSTASSYTYQHSNYNQGIAFKIDIGSAYLSDYDKISFTVNSTTGGNSQNKQCNVAASQSSVPAYVNPNTTNAIFVTTYNGSGNIIGSTWPTTLVYTIDKTKAASLTGEIWLAIFINAGSGSNYTISDFGFF